MMFVQLEDDSVSAIDTATPPPTLEPRPDSSATVDPATLAAAAEDSWKLETGKAYRWKDWRLIKSRDSFFIWCDAVAVEFRLSVHVK
jgi:hypothetical protein